MLEATDFIQIKISGKFSRSSLWENYQLRNKKYSPCAKPLVQIQKVRPQIWTESGEKIQFHLTSRVFGVRISYWGFGMLRVYFL